MGRQFTCKCGHNVTLSPSGAPSGPCPACGQPIVTQLVAAPQKTSRLAIVAFVCSLLFVIPLLPIVGVVLAIIALVKMGGGPDGKGRGLAIASIIIAVLGAIPGIGVFSALAIPAFLHYIREAKLAEAEENLARISSQVADYHAEHGALPPSSYRTPESMCSFEMDGRCKPGVSYEATAWQEHPWVDLGFSLNEPHYYQYELLTSDAGFTARAIGDLDADGIHSTLERQGYIQGGELVVDQATTRFNETE